MGRACAPNARARHQAATLIPHPDFAFRRTPIYPRRTEKWPCVPAISSGGRRARDRDSDALLDALDQGVCSARARRRARDRQDAPARRARRPRGRPRPARPLRLRLRARARPAVLGLRGRARRVPARARPGAARRPRRRRPHRARARLPVADGARGPRRTSRSSTSAIAATAPCGRCSSSSRRRSRSCSSSTICTGPTPASVELLGALLRRPPAGARARGAGHRPRQVPERLAAALERAERDGDAGPDRARRADRGRGAAARSATRSPARRSRPLRGERRQSLLSRAARPVDRPRAGGRPRDERPWAESVSPPSVAAALTEELALLSPRRPARARRRGGRRRPVRAGAGGGRGRNPRDRR